MFDSRSSVNLVSTPPTRSSNTPSVPDSSTPQSSISEVVFVVKVVVYNNKIVLFTGANILNHQSCERKAEDGGDMG